MGDAKETARRRFDRWASRYERDRRSRRNALPQREGLALLALRRDDRFLDVGCGTGAAVRAAAETAGRAVGVDLAPAMVGRARALAAGVTGAEFAVGDAERLPFPDGAFTAVLCSSSFHHYPDPAAALAEMARVLEPGGRVAVVDPNADLGLVRLADRLLRRLDAGHVRLYRSAELAALLAGAGFVDVRVRPVASRGYVLVGGSRPARAA